MVSNEWNIYNLRYISRGDHLRHRYLFSLVEIQSNLDGRWKSILCSQDGFILPETANSFECAWPDKLLLPLPNEGDDHSQPFEMDGQRFGFFFSVALTRLISGPVANLHKMVPISFFSSGMQTTAKKKKKLKQKYTLVVRLVSSIIIQQKKKKRKKCEKNENGHSGVFSNIWIFGYFLPLFICWR